MKSFEYARPKSLEEAVALLGPDVHPLGGGTDLLEMMKEGLLEPMKLVSLKGIPGLSYVREAGDGLHIGATTTLRDIAGSDVVRTKYPALAQAAAAVASPQIRNSGTLGGNLAQKVRCWYFREPQCSDCYKRGGSTCYAPFGDTTVHAIFDGAGCFAVHPSDTAVALTSLGARIVATGPKGPRSIPAAEFFAGPEVDYLRENTLAANELISEVHVPSAAAGQRSVFLKVGNRHSIDFALTSVAASVAGTPTVQDVSLVLGAVAPVPYRPGKAEEFLRGKRLTSDVINEAAGLAVEGAQPLRSNAYKVDLARGLVRQALGLLAA